MIVIVYMMTVNYLDPDPTEYSLNSCRMKNLPGEEQNVYSQGQRPAHIVRRPSCELLDTGIRRNHLEMRGRSW